MIERTNIIGARSICSKMGWWQFFFN